MKFILKADINIPNKNNGSSLAIALFFFMVCALMCAGLLFLANSTTHGVSKSLSIAKDQEFKYDESIITTPPGPTPTPTPKPGYETQSEAINTVYDKLYYDFYYSMTAIENGGQVTIKKSTKPENLSYEICSYINFILGSKNGHDPVYNRDVKVDADGNLSTYFDVAINGEQVKVIVTLSGATGSANNNLLFKKLKMEVMAPDGSGCSYNRYFEYTVPDGELFHIRYIGGNPKTFAIKGS